VFSLECLKLCCNLSTILDVVGNNFFELYPNECNLFIVLALCKIKRVNMSICLYTNATSTAGGFMSSLPRPQSLAIAHLGDILVNY